jgi:hypothetical protein
MRRRIIGPNGVVPFFRQFLQQFPRFAPGSIEATEHGEEHPAHSDAKAIFLPYCGQTNWQQFLMI